MKFTRRGSVVKVALDGTERDLLAQIPGLLASIGGDDDPARSVITRSAFPDDDLASEEFAAMVEDEMAATRAADRSIVTAVADGRTDLGRDDAIGLLRAVNEARLVLAARTGVLDGGPGWEAKVATDPVVAALAWLGHLESELLEALPPAA